MRTILIAVMCLLSLVSVAAAKSLALEAATSAPEGRRLSGEEIRTWFTGSSFYGTFTASGEEWAEETTPDGRVLDLTNVAELVGSWAVSGDKACYIYHQAPSKLLCYVMYEKSGNLLFYVDEGMRLNARTTKIVRAKAAKP